MLNTRFAIRRDQVWRPLFAIFGGTKAGSYVELESDGVRLHFGWAFNRKFSYQEIESVYPVEWPWYLGIGWRSNLIGRIGLVGSYRGTVEMRLRRTHWVWLAFIPLPCNRIAVSLEEPDAFIGALSPKLEPPSMS